jgi:hypothetical protein
MARGNCLRIFHYYFYEWVGKLWNGYITSLVVTKSFFITGFTLVIEIKDRLCLRSMVMINFLGIRRNIIINVFP